MSSLYKTSILFFSVFILFVTEIRCQIVTFEKLQDFILENPDVKTIYIRNGDYVDVNLSISRLDNISIKAETPGKVTLRGETYITIRNSRNFTLSGFHFQNTWSRYLIKLDKVSSSIIEECFFDNCRGNAYSRVIGLQGGSKDNRIHSNTFKSIHTMGITISRDGNYNNIISKNVFLDIPKVKNVHPETKDGNGMETISIGTIPYWDEDMEQRNFNTTISCNYFENIEGDMNEIISVKANTNFIKNNFFTKNKGGVSLRFGKNNLVKGNVFIENDQNIIIWGKDHIIADNIIYKDKIGIQLPSSNLINNRQNIRKKQSGFFQTENIIIVGNYISTLDKNPFFVGRHYSRERPYLPKKIIIQNNNYKIGNVPITNEHFTKFIDAFFINNTLTSNIEGIINNFENKNYYHGKSW